MNYTAKLTGEGAETNTRPETIKSYAIEKILQVTHHQGSENYEEDAGKQCTSNAYFLIIFSDIKNINNQKAFDLDYILQQRDSSLNCIDLANLHQ